MTGRIFIPTATAGAPWWGIHTNGRLYGEVYLGPSAPWLQYESVADVDALIIALCELKKAMEDAQRGVFPVTIREEPQLLEPPLPPSLSEALGPVPEYRCSRCQRPMDADTGLCGPCEEHVDPETTALLRSFADEELLA